MLAFWTRLLTWLSGSHLSKEPGLSPHSCTLGTWAFPVNSLCSQTLLIFSTGLTLLPSMAPPPSTQPLFLVFLGI